MTSSDPKSKTAMEVDEDDDEEYEYEEIEVEEEVEDDEKEEVEDDDEEEVEYEEIEEEVEYEEVEEEVEVEDDEEVEYEEVEEEVEVEEEEEIEYEEVEEEVEYEEVEEEVDDDDVGGDDEKEKVEEEEEEIGDKLAVEAKFPDVIDGNSHMGCMEHDMHSRQQSVAVEWETNVSLHTHPIDTTKQVNGDEMLATSKCPVTVKSEADIPSNILPSGTTGLGDARIKSDEQNRDGNQTSLADSGTSNTPKLLEHGVGTHSHHCSGIKDEPGSVDKSIPVDVPVKQCSAPESSNAQMGEDKATGIEVTAVGDVEPVDDGNHKASRSLQVRHRSPSPGAGYEDGNKRPAVICEYFAKGWCIKGSSCRFLHKRDHVDDHSQKVEGDMRGSNSKHPLGSGDVAGCSKLPAYFQADVGINDDALLSSSALNDIQLEHVEKDKPVLYEKEVAFRISASSQASPCNDKFNSIFDSKEVEGEIFRENYSFDRYKYREAAITGSGDGSVQQGPGQASGSYSKYQLPPHSGMSETASMRRQYSLDGFGSSGSVPYSSFMSSHMNTLKGSLISSKYKSSFLPYNWEPSVPFRPSFFIPSMTRTTSDVQYDPLRDSIEQPDVRHLPSHNPSELPDHRGSIFEYVQSISGRNALETNKNLHHDVWDENYYGHNKEVAPAGSAEASTNDVQNENIFEEENPLIPPSVKDMLKASRNATDGSCNLLSDGMGDGKIIATEKERISSHLDEEESKMIKYFRGALIEFVKELMRPVWHEGRLSKDVYKVIVQKAEDKILSTLPSDKVPNTSESIKQYLSSSRPKILKLIQAYVDKYGKF